MAHAKPQSIRAFGRLYLLSVAIALIASATAFRQQLAEINLLVAPAGLQIDSATLAVIVLVIHAIKLLPWYFVYLRGFRFAKWMLVIFLALALRGLDDMLAAMDLANAIALLAMLVEAIAVALLFRADAKAWLGGVRLPPRDVFE